MKITRSDIIDKLEDFYGITQDDLTPRELAIIGLAARDLFDEEVEFLNSYKASEKPSNCILAGVSFELPSDKEINEITHKEIPYNSTKREWFIEGMKCMRDFIKGN